jgi:hypothetical protein
VSSAVLMYRHTLAAKWPWRFSPPHTRAVDTTSSASPERRAQPIFVGQGTARQQAQRRGQQAHTSTHQSTRMKYTAFLNVRQLCNPLQHCCCHQKIHSRHCCQADPLGACCLLTPTDRHGVTSSHHEYLESRCVINRAFWYWSTAHLGLSSRSP